MNRKKKSFSLLKFLIFIFILFLLYFFITSIFNKPTNNEVINNDTQVINNDNNQTNSNTNNEERESDTNTKPIYYNNSHSYTTDWYTSNNVGKLNTNVLSGIRDRYTKIKGNNQDKITIMIFMCGSDLEAQAAMGSYDIQEMSKANISDNINLLVYTGGSTKWYIDAISTDVNQIYRIAGNGKIERLVDNAGSGSMVDPDTLQSFIEWSANNYEADRYELILWDHGAGSVNGYGHDLKYPRRGSMSLDQIDRALTNAGVKFDFVAFDACLMANTETAIMLSEHADYLIASEESEPGIGWYYTDWLNALSNNTSMPTIEIGKHIADSFVKRCAKETPRQSATLSVVDLAELQATIPDRLSAFAKRVSELLNNQEFKTVARARSGSREFAAESSVDLVDFTDMASKIDPELANALLSCIKYNNVSSDMTNSYGLSIYFPYRSLKYVNTVLKTYDAIGLSRDYIDCVKNFAAYQTSGQASSGGNYSAYESLFSSPTYSGNQYYSNETSSDLVYSLLEQLMVGSYSDNSNYSNYYDYGLTDILFGLADTRNIANYISDNHFDTDLIWNNGKINISKEQWELVDKVLLNGYIDDGKGYIDLGRDNIYDIDENGNLLSLEDKTWLGISEDGENYKIMPYYYVSEINDGDHNITQGRVPVLLNGTYANLIIVFDSNQEEAIIAGATYDYKGESDMIAKNLTSLQENDEIKLVCDFYDYDGNYNDSYILEGVIKYNDNIKIRDIDISDYNSMMTYEISDIYGQQYYSEIMK